MQQFLTSINPKIELLLPAGIKLNLAKNAGGWDDSYSPLTQGSGAALLNLFCSLQGNETLNCRSDTF